MPTNAKPLSVPPVSPPIPPRNRGSPFRRSSLLCQTGYGYVQVNPATESIQGSEWWTDYQVVSYKLQSKRGTVQQYKNMVDTCHSAGVKVIAGISTSSLVTPRTLTLCVSRRRIQPYGRFGQRHWYCRFPCVHTRSQIPSFGLISNPQRSRTTITLEFIKAKISTTVVLQAMT